MGLGRMEWGGASVCEGEEGRKEEGKRRMCMCNLCVEFL